MKKSLVAVMLGLMMTIAMTGCGGCGAEEVAIETEATEVVEETEEVVEETEVETEVVEEVAEEPVEVETETTVEEVSPYTYTELNQVMYAQSTVNVRDLPEQSGGKLGGLTTNQEVTVTGQCNETGWYRISYNGSEGFVSNSYLGTEKVAVQSSSGASSTAGSSSSSSGSSTPAEESAPAESTASAEETASGSTDSGQVKDDNYYYEQATTASDVTPDSWMCTWCNVDCGTYEGFVEHMKSVHNMQ